MIILTFQMTWEQFLSEISHPPGSMWFILGLSGIITVITTVLNRLLVDPKSMLEKQLKIRRHQERRKEIEKLKDENPKKYRKELEKWQRQDAAIREMQNKMSMERLKPTCVTFLPMIILFYIIRTFYGNAPVAIPPMNPKLIPFLANMMLATDGVKPEWGLINFTTWYFLSSITLNTLVQKALGLTPPGGMGGLGAMFEQSKYQYETKR